MTKSFTYKGATIRLPETEIEDTILHYLDEMEEHPMFTLDDIVLMPDVHPEPNSKTLVGFTMPFSGQLSPNIIGPDAGCGMMAVPVNNWEYDESDYDELISNIRSVVPMAKGQYSAPNRDWDNLYHLTEEFPCDEATDRIKQFVSLFDSPPEYLQNFIDNGGYSGEWIKNLPKRSSVDMNKMINGMGTLGGGNHFIEFAIDNTGQEWLVIHTGSRHVGGEIFNTHQSKANQLQKEKQIYQQICNLDSEYHDYLKFSVEDVTPHEAFLWVTGGMGDSHVKKDAIRSDYEGNKINEVFTELNFTVPDKHNWDYLENTELYQYYLDMVFAQVYAEENRWQIAKDVIGETTATISKEDRIDSPHNILDFKDGVIRKGSTRAHKGSSGVIPFNMEVGSVIFSGKGNIEWNNSVAHGSGRPNRRQDAKDQFEDDDTLTKPTVKTSGATPDEYPHAYKDPDMIQTQIADSVEITHILTPFLNFKGNLEVTGSE